MAGRDGNAESKIFAAHFEAELVGISNAFALCEEQPEGVDDNRPTVVWLEVEEEHAAQSLELRFKSFS